MWVKHGLLPDLWGTVGGAVVRRPGLVLRRNLIIGGLRARQWRSKLADNCDLPTGLRDMYTARCRSSDPETGSYGPKEGAFLPVTHENALEGQQTVFDAMFDVERPLSFAMADASFLEKNNWLDGATRSLELQAVMLNAEANIYVLMTIKFSFDFDGIVDRTVNVRMLDALGLDLKIMYYMPEIVWCCLILVLLRQELTEVFRSCWQRRFKAYFLDLWNWVDWVSIVLGVSIIGLWAFVVVETGKVSEKVAALPRLPFAQDFDFSAYHVS
jgi:hypothetical protein